MEIKIKTSAKNVEMANFFLGQAIDAAKDNQRFMEAFGLSKNDLVRAEQFRKSLLHAFTNGRIPAKVTKEF